jgi:Skp family chaperone for outer membrane proteins
VLIAVALSIAGILVANTEPISVSVLRERTARLETNATSQGKKLDEIQSDLKDLDKKLDDKTDAILRRLERTRR